MEPNTRRAGGQPRKKKGTPSANVYVLVFTMGGGFQKICAFDGPQKTGYSACKKYTQPVNRTRYARDQMRGCRRYAILFIESKVNGQTSTSIVLKGSEVAKSTTITQIC